jgi:hypothetical protein
MPGGIIPCHQVKIDEELERMKPVFDSIKIIRNFVA